MKLTLKALLVTLVCAGFAQVMRPETVRVRLYKTDPTTWNKPFYYDVAAEQVTKTITTPIIPQLTKGNAVKVARAKQQTPEVETKRSVGTVAYKPIKKDITISFDVDDENTLWVCPTPDHDERVCKKLILSTTPDKAELNAYILGDVIAIDKDYQPVSMSKREVNRIIRERQAKFFKIPVYKEDPLTWGEKWTVTLVDEAGEPYPDARVDIYKDSKFKRLLIQKDIEPGKTFVVVRNPHGYFIETPLKQSPVADPSKQLLVIDGKGNARIEDKSLFQSTPKASKKSPQKRVSEEGMELL